MDDVPLPWGVGLGILVLLLAIQAVLAASEIGFLAVSKARARRMRDEGSTAGAVLELLQSYQPLALAALLIGITASVYVAERLATEMAVHALGKALGAAVAVIGLSLIVLVFAEITPIQWAARNRLRAGRLAAFPVALLTVVTLPVSAVLWLLSAGLQWVLRRGRPVKPAYTEDELKTMIDEVGGRGEIEASASRMLKGVLDFGDQTAAQVMVPRNDMVAVEAGTTMAEALELLVSSRHSRLPVYDLTPDEIVGVLYAKDLLPYLRGDDLERPCRLAARQAALVPESLPIDDLLRQLQTQRRVMAIVKDEFGGTAGLITVEDLLEEIVGDILDEVDEEEPEITQVGDHEMVCLGTVNLHALANLVSQELPEGDYDSLGGLITELNDGVPEVGEEIPYGSLSFRIEAVEKHRVTRVRVVESPPDNGELEDL